MSSRAASALFTRSFQRLVYNMDVYKTEEILLAELQRIEIEKNTTPPTFFIPIIRHPATRRRILTNKKFRTFSEAIRYIEHIEKELLKIREDIK